MKLLAVMLTSLNIASMLTKLSANQIISLHKYGASITEGLVPIGTEYKVTNPRLTITDEPSDWLTKSYYPLQCLGDAYLKRGAALDSCVTVDDPINGVGSQLYSLGDNQTFTKTVFSTKNCSGEGFVYTYKMSSHPKCECGNTHDYCSTLAYETGSPWLTLSPGANLEIYNDAGDCMNNSTFYEFYAQNGGCNGCHGCTGTTQMTTCDDSELVYTTYSLPACKGRVIHALTVKYETNSCNSDEFISNNQKIVCF